MRSKGAVGQRVVNTFGDTGVIKRVLADYVMVKWDRVGRLLAESWTHPDCLELVEEQQTQQEATMETEGSIKRGPMVFLFGEPDAICRNTVEYLQQYAPNGGNLRGNVIYERKSLSNVRLAVSRMGEPIYLFKGSRRNGRGLYHNHFLLGKLTSVEIKLPKVVTIGQAYANRVRAERDYIAKHASPKAWDDLRAEYAAITDEALDAMAKQEFKTWYEAWQGAPILGLPRVEQCSRPTLTLKATRAGSVIEAGIWSAWDQQAPFEYHWEYKYDYSVSGRMCNDGIYRAWLSQEYRNKGNGHYWVMISPDRMIFGEDD